MQRTLEEIRGLLRKHDFPGQAEVMDDLLRLIESNYGQFVRKIQGVDVWGGSGAVWEVGSFANRGFPAEFAIDDELQFRRAIIQLSHQMDESGIGTDRARYIASVFNDWLQKGL